jgi:S-adenosylmethionine:diacylglycerol 3-amino-3-carboxypropyl transferase
MHEDVAIELKAFAPGSRVFCIASAGCTAMALAADHEVVAADINPVQLAYVKRRLAGEAVQDGAAERLLAGARVFAPSLGWSRRRMRAFLDLSDPAEQIAFWRRHLDTRRFHAALFILFSLPALRLIYSASLLASLPRSFGAIIRRRLERGFARHPNRTNPYARALFLGEHGPSFPVRNRIELVQSDAAAYLEAQPAGSFDGFALSNILDGASEAYRRRLVAAVQHAAAPEAVTVWRSFREPAIPQPTNHAAEDRALLWGIVDIRPATALRADG